MARRYGLFQNLRTIAGMTLIGLGLFVLFDNVNEAAGRLSRVAGVSADSTQTFGELTVAGLAASRAIQCYLFDRVGFARGICKLLLSLWPLLLVIAGTILTGMVSRTDSRNVQKRIQDLSI
jgi:hypothetical protein